MEKSLLKADLKKITTPGVTDEEIWKFVRDPLNVHVVYVLAEERLKDIRDSKDRQSVRRVERKSWNPARTKAKKPSTPPTKPSSPDYQIVAPSFSDLLGDLHVGSRYLADKQAIEEAYNLSLSLILPSANKLRLSNLIDSGFPRVYISSTFNGTLSSSMFSLRGWEWVKETQEGKLWAASNPDIASVFISGAKATATAKTELSELETRMRTEAHSRIQADVDSTIDRYMKDFVVSWTAELLSRTFDLSGATIAWGDATVLQHRERLSLLKSQASGTIVTAALHQRAIDDLTAAHANSLSDIVDNSVPELVG